MAAEGELGDDPLLDRRGPELPEMGDLAAQRVLVGEIVERGAAPERVGDAVEADCGRGIRGDAPAGRGDVRLEAAQVELLGFGVQDVAARPVLQPIGAERLAQARDVGLQHVAGRRRRGLGPDLLDQAVRRDDGACAQEQEREHGPLLGSAERDRRVAGPHLQRPKQPEVHEPKLPLQTAAG